MHAQCFGRLHIFAVAALDQRLARRQDPFRRLAHLAPGGVHDHDAVAVVDGLGEGATGGDALVVGVARKATRVGIACGPST